MTAIKQPVVEHVEACHASEVGDGLVQSRVVRDAQVATKPHNRGGIRSQSCSLPGCVLTASSHSARRAIARGIRRKMRLWKSTSECQ